MIIFHHAEGKSFGKLQKLHIMTKTETKTETRTQLGSETLTVKDEPNSINFKFKAETTAEYASKVACATDTAGITSHPFYSPTVKLEGAIIPSGPSKYRVM